MMHRGCFLLVATMVCVAPHARAATIGADGLEAGGSNYFTYSVNFYPWIYPDVSLVYHPLMLRPVIGTLHYDPERVRAQLRLMHDRGQRKIALNLSYGPFEDRGLTLVDGVWGYSMKSDDFELTPLHQHNLRTLLGFIRDVGFEEIQFRFGPEAWGHPAYWAQWDEVEYQRNWNFLARTRVLIDDELAGSTIVRRYDLLNEGAGVRLGQSEPYLRRLWIDYNMVFGGTDAYHSVIGNRQEVEALLTAYIRSMDATGMRPSEYAVDVYNDAYETLRIVAGVLRRAGEITKPVLIQEAFYNDPFEYAEILAARRDFGLNIRSIMQWPNSRDSGVPAFDRDFALEYANYTPKPATPSITSTRGLCTIPAGGLVCDTTVIWNTGSAAFGVVTISGVVVTGGSRGTIGAPWMHPGPYSFLLQANANGVPGAVLDSTMVYSIPTKGTLTSASPTHTCRLEGGASTCALEVFWSVPDAYTEGVVVRVNGLLRAFTVMIGRGVLEGIPTQGATVELYLGNTRLDTLIVRAVP